MHVKSQHHSADTRRVLYKLNVTIASSALPLPLVGHPFLASPAAVELSAGQARVGKGNDSFLNHPRKRLNQLDGGDHALDACHVEVIPQLIFRRRCRSGSKRPSSAVFVRVSPPVPPLRHTWTRSREVKMSSFSDAQRPGRSSIRFTIVFRVVLCGDLYRGLPALRSRARSYSRDDGHAILEVYRCKTGGPRPS